MILKGFGRVHIRYYGRPFRNCHSRDKPPKERFVKNCKEKNWSFEKYFPKLRANPNNLDIIGSEVTLCGRKEKSKSSTKKSSREESFREKEIVEMSPGRTSGSSWHYGPQASWQAPGLPPPASPSTFRALNGHSRL
jgi:hypothetical protein